MDNALLSEQSTTRVRQCRHAVLMYNRNDTVIGTSLDLYGEYAEGEFQLLSQILQPGMIVLDVGANIGTHTTAFAKAVAPNGVVMAFEPQRLAYQMLCGNVALNALPNVVAHNFALGAAPASLQMPAIDVDVPGDFSAACPSATGNGEPVAVATIDSLGLSQCHFIKVDVAGMEREVVEGAADTLARCKPLLYVKNSAPAKSAALIETLMKADYRLYWHAPIMFNAENHAGNTNNIFARRCHANILCMPRSVVCEMNAFDEITSPDAVMPQP